jgi:hypothetical protein
LAVAAGAFVAIVFVSSARELIAPSATVAIKAIVSKFFFIF